MPDQVHAVPVDVVHAAHKRGKIGSPSFGRQNGLGSRKDQGAIGADAQVRKMRNRFDSLPDHRHFHNNVWREVGQAFAFFHHALKIGGNDFGADIPIHDIADILIVAADIFFPGDAFFCHQGWIGGHTVQNTEIFCFFNLLETGGIDEKFHWFEFFNGSGPKVTNFYGVQSTFEMLHDPEQTVKNDNKTMNALIHRGCYCPNFAVMKLKNDLLLRVANGESVNRPPVWLMRQAGRVLPQYRAIREKLSGFRDLVQNPQLAAEATIQPVDEWGVDAAIIFSDILVVPEAMGLPYEMAETKGPYFPATIRSAADIDRLISGEEAAYRLNYVYEALKHTTAGLNGRVPLIGFAGAPWTILAYMVEGKGSKTFDRAKRMLYSTPQLAHQLLDKITETTIAYLNLQVASGAHILQLFDSWAGLLSPGQYAEFGYPYIRRICEAVASVPVIVFAKGAWFALPELNRSGAAVIGLDWNIRPETARALTSPDTVFQGNLDPCALYAAPDQIRDLTREMLTQFGGRHIANLGHGLYPDISVESVRVFVETVKGFDYQSI